ncbi:MAG: hypothetical protein F6J97_22945 [Leptolyngbya sp. SIO4C1]|nr:hypothetical protein [Leptolyngbya sp. SIO4C1]
MVRTVKAVCWAICLSFLASCQPAASPSARVINLQQQWELEPGDIIAGRLVTGSLGDVSIALEGRKLYAPFDGDIEPATQPHCVIYSTPEVPAYLFRFCGLRRLQLGPIRAGQTIGSADHLQFATMRRQPDGTWIIVEPSTGILERAIQPAAVSKP